MSKKRNLILSIISIVLLLSAFTIASGDSDKVAFFTSLHIREDQTVNGDAVAIFGDIRVDGTVRGDAVAVFGNVVVNGTINGDTVAVAGAVEVGSNGVISGDAVGVGGGVIKERGAVIRGEEANAAMSIGINRHNILPVITYASIIGLLITYALSWLVIIIIPSNIENMAVQSLDNLGRRFGIGLLAYILLPVFALALIITMVGIIVLPFFLIAFAIASFISMIPLKIAIGRRIAASVQNSSSIYVHLLVGLIIVYLIKLIPIIGWLVYVFLAAVAMGLLIDTRMGGAFRRKV
ncbi:MAG: hypothetical protein ACOZCL_16585 [Bacillota bacterium]